MTSASSETRPFRTADLGTVVLLAWLADGAEGDTPTPCLLACSPGDGPDGAQGSSAAVEHLLKDLGMRADGQPVDGTSWPSLKISTLLVAGQIVLRMPHLNSQCTPSPEWCEVVRKLGYAYFMLTTRPCPAAGPGRPVEGAALAAFAGSEETTNAAAHVYLPARSLRC